MFKCSEQSKSHMHLRRTPRASVTALPPKDCWPLKILYPRPTDLINCLQMRPVQMLRLHLLAVDRPQACRQDQVPQGYHRPLFHPQEDYRLRCRLARRELIHCPICRRLLRQAAWVPADHQACVRQCRRHLDGARRIKAGRQVLQACACRRRQDGCRPVQVGLMVDHRDMDSVDRPVMEDHQVIMDPLDTDHPVMEGLHMDGGDHHHPAGDHHLPHATTGVKITLPAHLSIMVVGEDIKNIFLSLTKCIVIAFL